MPAEKRHRSGIVNESLERSETERRDHSAVQSRRSTSLRSGLSYFSHNFYDVVDLPDWDFDKLVGQTELRLAMGILHKMTGDSPDDFPEALLPLLEISDEEQRIELTKELLDFVAKAFAAHNRRVDEAMVSKAIQPILRGKEQTMIKSIFDEKVDEGIAIGEARGKTVLGRNMVLTALRTKFRRVPKDIEKAVSAMSDPIALESLLVQAINSNTIDEFAEVLR